MCNYFHFLNSNTKILNRFMLMNSGRGFTQFIRTPLLLDYEVAGIQIIIALL